MKLIKKLSSYFTTVLTFSLIGFFAIFSFSGYLFKLGYSDYFYSFDNALNFIFAIIYSHLFSSVYYKKQKNNSGKD